VIRISVTHGLFFSLPGSAGPADYVFYCGFLFLPIHLRPVISSSAGTDLRQMFRVGRTVAVDD